jgi:uncharacterized delta-60 repeat protein
MKTKNIIFTLLIISFVNQEIIAQNWNTSFGNNGYSKIEIPNRNTRGNVLLRLNDGSLLVGINSDYNQWGALFDRNVYIYKLNPNGIIDTTFGTNGFFFIPSGSFENISWLTSLTFSNFDNLIYCFATVSGTKKIFRMNTDGILDSSFGSSGFLNETNTGLYILLIQNDGKILLAGCDYNNTTNQSLKRYNTNGTIDTTFGNNGVVINNLTIFNYDIVTSAKLFNDKITLVGYSYDNGEAQSHATISRYNLNGSLDSTFGTNGGYTITNIGPENYACYRDLDINNNGEIIVAGYNIYSGGTGGWNGNKAIIVKYNSDGVLENNFNGNGIRIFDSLNNANDYFNTVSYLSDGKIVAGGSSGSPYPNIQSYYYITKVNSDGTFNTSFFNSGYLSTNFDNGVTNIAHEIITTSNDEIFSIGITKDITDSYFIAVVCKMDNTSLSNNEFSENEDYIKCYPNPVENILTVHSKINIKDMQLFSIDGRELEEIPINKFEDKIILNFENLSDANYLLKITDTNGLITTKKIIKK